MASKPTLKLVALDLDGTLLDSTHQLTHRTRRAVLAAEAQGVRVMLATGKTFQSTRHLTADLKLTTPLVCVQGTVIHNPDGSIRQQYHLPVEPLRRLIPFIESYRCCVMAYSGETIMLRQPDKRADLTRYHEPDATIVGSLINAMNSRPINKLVVVADTAAQARALGWQVQQMAGDAVRLTVAGIPTQFEILPKNVSKGESVAWVAKEMGIEMSEVLAVGDADNDYEMLQLAGVGVAMGHASARLKEIAAFVTATNDQDGVAQALERFVLAAPKEEPADA